MPKQRKSSRPSLSDRTIESLQTIPTTPKERRRSSFFSQESPMGPPLRPASAMSRPGSSSSRPGTSDGSFAKPALPVGKRPSASAKPATRTSLGGFGFTPGGTRRSVSTSFQTKLQSSKTAVPPSPRAASPTKAGASKTLSARPSKPRPALGDAFAPPTKSTKAPVPTEEASSEAKPASSSSAALRQQIAAAKAAARKEKERTMHDSPQDQAPVSSGTFDFDADGDPFNQAPKDSKHMLRNRINKARMDGKLNIAGMGLKEIPSEVMQMYDAAAMEESMVNWAEVVDLTRFIAADNEIAEIGASVFPDLSAEELFQDEETHGNQFGGLELLDLHSNTLTNAPLGLRRLERLTTLNLSHNQLDNRALEVISQIKPLKDLKIGNNNLSGHLSNTICELQHLQTLELQGNRLLALPESIRELTGLRTLKISGNQLTSLPMEALQQLPLIELDASSNALMGSLFPLGGVSEHPTLRTLNVANNSLAALSFMGAVAFPQLQTLDVTNNHLTILPPMNDCIELITLAAGDNKISELPEGFTDLSKLRNVNFSGNDLHALPPQLANMESLESLVLSSNPLSVRKYLTMNAADIKRDLRTRLEPEDQVNGDSGVSMGGDGDVHPTEQAPIDTRWTLKANGLLDLSSQNLTDDINTSLAEFLAENEVRQLHLQGNKLTCFPAALQAAPQLRVLDLSNNPLHATDYLPDHLDLPSLQELHLQACRLTSLHPLTHLQAPSLRTLDLTANRLTGILPLLREVFPSLTTLLAKDCKFSSVSASALRGLTTVNLASNDLQELPAEIGLLWEEGLKNLEVGSNAFRVPGYRVLEKGTEATLRWLRDRLPASGGEVD